MINENKKGVRAVKHPVKTKNPVAKAHQTVGSGSGEHKDKKRSADQVRGQKHKNKELAEFAALAPIAGAVGRAVVGGIARTAANAFADDEKTENVDDAEYNDEAGMADNNLETLHRAVVGLDELISEGDNLPEWCQEKIAVAKSMLVTVWDYMQSEEDSLAEGPGFDKWADTRAASQLHKLKPGMVQDRKTGKWYDPKKEFDKKMNSPEVMAQMKRMATKEGKENKIAQLKKDHETAVHWSKNEKSPQKREAARQKAEKIKRHLDTQYKQGVAEEKVKGVDGKACWKGKRYAGKVKKADGTYKDKCVPMESNWYELRLQTMLNETLKK